MNTHAEITFEQFKEEWLTDVRQGNPSTVELGRRFAHKLLTQWRDIDPSSDDVVYCDGSGDGGIDVAYLDRGEDADTDVDLESIGDTWYLVQSKYGSAFQVSDTLLRESRKVIDTLDGTRTNLASLAQDLIERLHTFRRQASERDRIVLVFATVPPLTQEQKGTLDDVRNMGRGRLGPAFDVEAVSVETIYQRTLEEILARSRVNVALRAELSSSGEGLLVGSVPLIELYNFLKAYRGQTEDMDKLYEKNVRRFLGSRTRVNKAIQKTLQEAPELFGLYNNGITIVVQDFQRDGDGLTTLVDPYVVNGCQTTKTIWEVFHRKLETGGTGSTDPKIQTWRGQAAQGVVVTKVVRVGHGGEDLLRDITRWTNTQNAVREKDFLALSDDFSTWSRQMADRYDIFLEVQRGAWDSQRAYQKQHPGAKQFKEHANAADLLKIYGAGWLREAGTAFGKNGPFLPSGSVFKRIVGDSSADGDIFGVDDLYTAYRLDKEADRLGFGRGAEQPTRRQTRFLFCMTVLELLRHVLILSQRDPTPKLYTRTLLVLWAPGNEPAAQALMDAAANVVDEYMTPGAEDSMHAEPEFKKRFNDVNTFLKWEGLGKSEENTPRYRTLIALSRKMLTKKVGGQPSDFEVIRAAIQ